jgi:two-component system sensor kinase FixL
MAEGEGEGPEQASHIISVTDVTTVEEAALRREEYDASLADASRLLAYAAISGGIVHEISQPLAAIRNYAYSLKMAIDQKKPVEEQRAVVHLLGDEIDRAIEVVRNVRRIGPQHVQDAGVCDVREAIAHSVRLVTLGSNPPPPITVVDGGGKALITGSLPMIGQVVINLLKNALSASSAADRSGAEVKVTLRDSHAEIAVADFGTGISPETAKSMFAPFSKSARGGMGLGLAICQRIAATLGGSLSWENREQGGAIFRFTVPLANQGSVS